MDKREKIKESARIIFGEKGFKNTGVADIAKAADIAAGTFYLYYPSKDALFMEIYLEENLKLKKRVMEALSPDDTPMETMQKAMAINLEGMNSNPILREWYNREVFKKIEKSFCDSGGIEEVNFVYELMGEAVETWQKKGVMRSDISADMITALFAAIINADTHKEEIGIKYFPEILTHLSEFVVKGLLK